jgi:hypothetical protein
MLSAKSVIPECYIDSNLFDVLFNFEKESVNHTKGNGTVVKKMELKFAELFCVGVIDKDKRDLKQIEANYDCIEVDGVNEYFRLFKHRKKHHYLIQIIPVIETWIINVVSELDINVADFIGVSVNNVVELSFITKKVDKKTEPKFKALFKEIVKQAKAKNFLPVLKLKKIIETILKENYKVDTNKLKNV